MFAQGDVGGRKADGAAALVAQLDGAFDFPGMAQKLGRFAHPAGAQRLADAGRGIDLAFAHHRIEHGDAKALLPALLAQHLDIAAAAGAEGKIVAAHDMARAHALQQHVVDEGVGRQGGKGLVEVLRQHRLHAVLFQEPQPGGRQGQPERTGVGHEEAARMRLEGEGHDRRVQDLGMLGGPVDQRLVAAMHAVEIAQRHRPALPLRRAWPASRSKTRDHFFGVRRGTETTASPSITTVSPARHCVFIVTRRRSWLMSVMVQTAVTVSPIETGAVKFSVCET